MTNFKRPRMLLCGLIAAITLMLPFGAVAAPAPAVELWPGGVVFYRFSSDVPTFYRLELKLAMEAWMASGVVVFVEKPNSLSSRLAWLFGADTSLLIRRNRNLNVFGLSSLGAGRWRLLEFNPELDDERWLRSSFTHELGHVLGLLHEHQRADRDLYIDIPIDFIARAGERAADYQSYDDWPALGDVSPYDYDSIMHYGSNIDGNRLVRRDTGKRIPLAEKPSAGDLRRVRLLYADESVRREAFLPLS